MTMFNQWWQIYCSLRPVIWLWRLSLCCAAFVYWILKQTEPEKKFKLASEEIDKMFNIWILHVLNDKVEKEWFTHEKYIFILRTFSRQQQTSLNFVVDEGWTTFWQPHACLEGSRGKISLPVGVVVPFRRRCLRWLDPVFLGEVPSYFEALWYPHLYFYRKSNT